MTIVFLPTLLLYIVAYKYVAIFSLNFISSLCAPIIPGNALLVALGSLSSTYILSFWSCLICVFSAKTFADSIGYFLTYKFGDKILNLLKIKRNEKFVKAEKYLQNYSFGTIFLTRLAGPFSPLINFISGLIEIPYKKFILADILGNLTGTTFFLMLGYYFTEYCEIILENDEFWEALILAIFVLYILYKTLKRNINKNLKGKEKMNSIDIVYK